MANVELALEERETCLNMAADDRGNWQVFSDDPVMQRRFEAAGAVLVREAGPSKFYTLRADQVLIRRGKRVMSDTQRAAKSALMRERNQNASRTRKTERQPVA